MNNPTPSAEDTREQSQRTVLLALNGTGKHIYAGTVPAHITAKRRAKNKAARKSRRMNRSAR